MNVLVSACLLGTECKYNQGSNESEQVKQLLEEHHLIPVCPEIMGGLPTPRTPAEVRGEKVITKDGKDVTAEFQKGAGEALRLAELYGCCCAVLKEKSPSCGSGNIYDDLREEFSNNLFVIFMLSSNYYKSAPCLNEMGATWVLKKKYQSILLPGFEYSQIKGAIDPCDISFKLDDKKYRTSALGELKDNIVQFLELDNVDVSKWDYQRERFFSMIDEATTN